MISITNAHDRGAPLNISRLQVGWRRSVLGGASAALAHDSMSCNIDSMSCDIDTRSPVKNVEGLSMLTSKAFRCTLPMLRDDQVTILRRWADHHCAQSIVFRDDRGSVVFVGLKDEFRVCASFGRTIRTALLRLCIKVPLRGRWCSLITAREALSICANASASRGADAGAQPAERLASPHDDDNDVRVVALSG